MISTRHGSFFSLVFFWLCVVALAPLLVMAIQGYHCSRQAVIDRAESHLVSVLESRRSMLRQWMDERKSDIRSLSVLFYMWQIDRPSMPLDTAAVFTRSHLLLDRIKADNPSFETIYIYDNQWNKILESEPTVHSEQSMFDTSFVSGLQRTKNIVEIGEAHLHEDGRIGVHAGYRAVDDSDRTLGYVLINLNLSSTIDPILLDRAGLGQSGKVYLYFPSGNRYYLPSNLDELPNPVLPAGDQERHYGPSISEYRDFQGNKVLGIASRLSDMDADLVVEIDQAEAFEWVRILGIRALITGAITLIVVIFIALSVSRKLTDPLKKLEAVSTKVASGEHAQRADMVGGTEIREVARSFNKMLDDLLESNRRVVRMESLAAVGEMSSAIVHELRNPLSSIKINFQAFQAKLEGESDYAELVQITHRQIDRLEQMLSSLLGYAKPLELHFAAVDIERLVSNVTETVGAELEVKACRLVVENRLADKPLIADSEQLRIALSNLVLNAAQASPDSGEIVLEIGPQEPSGEHVKISVADQGQGIPAERRDELFKPFFSTRKDGTGLGLAIVKKIAEYHGGEVKAGNRDGRGAMFTMILPRGGAGA